jgi:drug/metabolite transporter (DMT)-like permease
MGRRAGVALVAVSAVSFGCLALFARIALDNGLSLPMLLFLRFAIASLIMFGAAKVQGLNLPTRSQAPKLMLLGTVYVGQAVCFFSALRYIPTNLVSLLLYTYPVLVTLMAWLFLHERLTLIKISCLAMALAGSALTIGATGDAKPIGILLGCGSAVFYSIYIVLGSRFMREVNVVAGAAVVMTTTAGAFAIWAAVDDLALPASAEAWFGVLGLAVIGTAVAISTMFAGLERIGPVNTSTISALEPVVTATLGALFLSENLTGLQVAGGVLIILATIILARAIDAKASTNPAV